jgi:hypothetical protein
MMSGGQAGSAGMDLGIKDRKAIVCAASKGLGKACAMSLAVACAQKSRGFFGQPRSRLRRCCCFFGNKRRWIF